VNRNKRKDRFEFADYADEFDDHITKSIPGYTELIQTCAALSRRYVQNGRSVLDIGCTTGTVLAAVRDANQGVLPQASYTGIDIEPTFAEYWRHKRASNLDFVVADVRSFGGIKNISLALSLFTIQFLAEQDKLPVLKSVHDGLISGGALIIAEKVLANSARFQDALTFDYYDFKRRSFSADEILDKERGLRGTMNPWTASELNVGLRAAGFMEIQEIWRRSHFVGILALKGRAADRHHR
jgi:tRNA (cmo5U34)-methyltransferase